VADVLRSARPAIAATALDESHRRLVDDFGHVYARDGLTLTVGRLLGLLLLSDRPLSLDDIATMLNISKSGASTAARDLKRIGAVRRLGTPGSRRVLYESSDDMDALLQGFFVRVRQSLGLVRRGEPLLDQGPAKRRLRLMSDFHEFWLQEMEGIMARWNKRRDT
jgi:DNA-binding MarR family transcriptional regulator